MKPESSVSCSQQPVHWTLFSKRRIQPHSPIVFVGVSYYLPINTYSFQAASSFKFPTKILYPFLMNSQPASYFPQFVITKSVQITKLLPAQFSATFCFSSFVYRNIFLSALPSHFCSPAAAILIEQHPLESDLTCMLQTKHSSSLDSIRLDTARALRLCWCQIH